MATYASLTAEQKDAVQSFVNPLRTYAATLARLAVIGQRLSADWNGGVSTIVGTLGSDEIIPNTSGLDGAQGVAPADVVNFAGYAINLADPARPPTSGNGDPAGSGGGYNSAFIQALEVKLAGINATIPGIGG